MIVVRLRRAAPAVNDYSLMLQTLVVPRYLAEQRIQTPAMVAQQHVTDS
jgi:hypothetical protein